MYERFLDFINVEYFEVCECCFISVVLVYLLEGVKCGVLLSYFVVIQGVGNCEVLLRYQELFVQCILIVLVYVLKSVGVKEVFLFFFFECGLIQVMENRFFEYWDYQILVDIKVMVVGVGLIVSCFFGE